MRKISQADNAFEDEITKRGGDRSR